MDITYHYPPELFQLLVDTIPRLCRSKRDVVIFFRGAGIERSMISDFERQVAADPDKVNKFDIVRAVLQRLNERGEPALAERREVLRRVVEFEDFSTCWPNDELEAKGLVSEIRRVVNVKDSFTRMRQERESERQKHITHKEAEQQRAREKKAELDAVRRDLAALFAQSNPQKRGALLESVLNRLFKVHGILVRDAFRRQGDLGEGVLEQIDGVIALEGDFYLVEMKWLKGKVEKGDVSEHLVRVYGRDPKRGIFISATEFTAPSLVVCQEALQQAIVFLCTLEELVKLVDREGDLVEFLNKKRAAAVIDRKPYVPILS